MGNDAPTGGSCAPLLALARAVSAVVRLSLGPLMPLLVVDLKVDVLAKGQLLSAFSTGYLLTQVVGGCVADRIGARLVVLWTLVATSALVYVAPHLAQEFGVEGLTALYLTLGFVNGPLFPACSVMLRDVSSKNRSQAMAIVDAGGTLGGCIATAGCPLLASYIGWPRLFEVLAAVAAACALLWWRAAVDPRPVHSPDEDAEKSADSGALAVFRFAGPWALFWSHSVFNYANYFLNAWLPTMFVERFPGMDAATAGAYLLWPELAGVAARFATATLADRMLALGRIRLQPLRRTTTCLAFVFQGVFLLAAVRRTDPFECAVLLVLAAASSGVHSCGFKANYLELTKIHSGVLTGVGNTVASVSSAAGPVVTSGLLARMPGNWEVLFAFLFALNASGALVAAAALSVENLDVRSSKQSGTEPVPDTPKTAACSCKLYRRRRAAQSGAE